MSRSSRSKTVLSLEWRFEGVYNYNLYVNVTLMVKIAFRILQITRVIMVRSTSVKLPKPWPIHYRTVYPIKFTFNVRNLNLVNPSQKLYRHINFIFIKYIGLQSAGNISNDFVGNHFWYAMSLSHVCHSDTAPSVTSSGENKYSYFPRVFTLSLSPQINTFLGTPK